MEFIQFHPTGMVWPPSVKGILVTESVRGDGGVLRNSEGKRFMFDYVPDVFRAQYADTEAEADRWYNDPDNNQRPPELLPRDEVARAINSEVKAGSRLTARRRVPRHRRPGCSAEEIIKRLPSMHHQFKELADVDITAEPMEVGPTCHYVMGGVEVDPDTAAARRVPGLFAAGEVAGGMHGSNRLGGNSLSDLLVFGRRAGIGAAEYVGGLGERPADGRRRRRRRGPGHRRQPFGAVRGADRGEREPVHAAPGTPADDERPGRHHPQEAEIEEALEQLAGLQGARRAGSQVEGHRQFNPGWHLALDLRNMLLVSECVAEAALDARGEPRRPHPRRLSRRWTRSGAR